MLKFDRDNTSPQLYRQESSAGAGNMNMVGGLSSMFYPGASMPTSASTSTSSSSSSSSSSSMNMLPFLSGKNMNLSNLVPSQPPSQLMIPPASILNSSSTQNTGLMAPVVSTPINATSTTTTSDHLSSLLLALTQHQHEQHQHQQRQQHHEISTSRKRALSPSPASQHPSFVGASLRDILDHEERQLQLRVDASKRQQKKEQAAKKSPKKDTKWMLMLQELIEYKKQTGNTIVPRGYAPNPRLSSWVAEQRKQFKLYQDGKPSNITAQRIEHLDAIGFVWNAQKNAWDQHMNDLRAFRSAYGHCLVPLNHPRWPKLGLWIKEQRRHYTLMKQGKNSHMTAARQAQLDSLGFCWDSQEASWSERYRELAEFRNMYGNCLVPTGYAQDQKLRTWIHHQRRQYKKFMAGKTCHITRERIEKLNALGFVWSPRDYKQASSDDSNSASSSSSVASSSVSLADTFDVHYQSFLPASKRQRAI